MISISWERNFYRKGDNLMQSKDLHGYKNGFFFLFFYLKPYRVKFPDLSCRKPLFKEIHHRRVFFVNTFLIHFAVRKV